MNECLEVTVCNVKIGKCIFTTCEHFFFLSTHSHCELIFVLFFCFFFHQTAKTKQNKLKEILL